MYAGKFIESNLWLWKKSLLFYKNANMAILMEKEYFFMPAAARAVLRAVRKTAFHHLITCSGPFMFLIFFSINAYFITFSINDVWLSTTS